MQNPPNRKLAEDYMDAWSGSDAARLETLLDPAFSFSNPPPGFTGDKKGAIGMAAAFRAGFPDLKVRYTDWLEQGDRVVVRFIGTGTHGGDFMGTPATQSRVEVTGLSMLTLRNGKVASEVTEFDGLGLLTQIGAIEMPGAVDQDESAVDQDESAVDQDAAAVDAADTGDGSSATQAPAAARPPRPARGATHDAHGEARPEGQEKAKSEANAAPVAKQG